MKIKYVILAVLLLVSSYAQAQILISALFGDKLNSPTIEFGLEGGYNRSYFHNVAESDARNNFNLGFYFHILLKNNSFISTGLRVKSNVGATGMSTYPIGDDAFDEMFRDGELTTKISYLYLPVMFQQRIYKIILLEGGFQAGLRTKANDSFSLSAYDGELNYKLDVKDDYTRLDAGLMGGMGFKLKNQPKSMSIGIHYYYGLVNISKLPDTSIQNSSLYLSIKIPIGIGSGE
jgi:hypothetical protein